MVCAGKEFIAVLSTAVLYFFLFFYLFYFLFYFIVFYLFIYFLFSELTSLSNTLEWFVYLASYFEVYFVSFQLEICSPYRF